MTKEEKINIVSTSAVVLACLLDMYLNTNYITLIVMVIDFIFMKVYEKKTGIRLYRTGRNKWLDLMLLILIIVLLIMVGLFVYALLFPV